MPIFAGGDLEQSIGAIKEGKDITGNSMVGKTEFKNTLKGQKTFVLGQTGTGVKKGGQILRKNGFLQLLGDNKRQRGKVDDRTPRNKSEIQKQEKNGRIEDFYCLLRGYPTEVRW